MRGLKKDNNLALGVCGFGQPSHLFTVQFGDSMLRVKLDCQAHYDYSKITSAARAQNTNAIRTLESQGVRPKGLGAGFISTRIYLVVLH